MRLSSRLEQAERKAGGGREPTIVLFRTIYEDRDGNPERQYRRAVIVGGLGDSTFLEPDEAETDESFTARINAECLRLHGRLPRKSNKSSGKE